MKKIKQHIFLIGTFLSIMSCNSFLDVVPDNVATIDIAFNSRVNAERFFFTLYGYMPAHASIENPALLAGDEIWVNNFVSENWAGLNIARGNQGVTNPFLDYWSNYDIFVAIRDCNIFLQNINKPEDLDPFERNRWIAEAKFLKAYYHFWLLRMYGPIPILRENISVSDNIENVRIERRPVDEVVNYIVKLLDEAITDLPLVIENRGEELGRATKSIAASIKARVLMTAASPIFNGNDYYSNFTNSEGQNYINPNYSEEKWQIAMDACKEAIEFAKAGGHSLYTFPGSAIYDLSDTTILKMSLRGAISERWNPEIIWGSTNPTASSIQNWSFVRVDPTARAEVLGSVKSFWAPTLRMAELFYSDNGVPIEEDKSFNYDDRYSLETVGEDHKYYMKEGYQTITLHLNREARFYSSLAFDGSIIYGQGRLNDKDSWVVYGKSGQVSARFNNEHYSITGYWPKKLINQEDVLGNSYSQEAYPWPVVRLADLYLLYAEALNEVNGPSQDVYEYIDKIRTRAGLKGVVESWMLYSSSPSKPKTKEGMRDIIHRERLIELAFEGQRFWDLRRWMKMEEFMNSDIQGWDLDQKSAKEYYRPRTIETISYTKKDYLWPIAESDIIVNPNLDQAPGW